MAKKRKSSRLPAITAPHPSKKRESNSKLSPTASVYHFIGDNTFRVFWTNKDGETMLQLMDKSKPYFPQAQREMDRLMNLGRIIPVSEIPIRQWMFDDSSLLPSSNSNIHLKGTIYEQ